MGSPSLSPFCGLTCLQATDAREHEDGVSGHCGAMGDWMAKYGAESTRSDWCIHFCLSLYAVTDGIIDLKTLAPVTHMLRQKDRMCTDDCGQVGRSVELAQ